MITIINLLKARNLIDGIGIQAHYFNLDSMTAAQMTTGLDAYAATGLDLYISELDMKGPLQTEASQSAQYQAIFPAIWTHPAVKGVTLWGYIDGQTWSTGTGIMNSNGTERAALTWLKGYVTGVTAPAAPTNLVAGTVSTTSLGLNWTDNANNETAYKVEMASTSTGPWTEITGALAAGTVGYAVTGLSPSTTYFFRVRASNSAGDSAYSGTSSATTFGASNPAPKPSGGGGGGAPSLWFLGLLGLTALIRQRSART
jgi:endo-1,4-beta-xylanase